MSGQLTNWNGLNHKCGRSQYMQTYKYGQSYYIVTLYSVLFTSHQMIIAVPKYKTLYKTVLYQNRHEEHSFFS